MLFKWFIPKARIVRDQQMMMDRIANLERRSRQHASLILKLQTRLTSIENKDLNELLKALNEADKT